MTTRCAGKTKRGHGCRKKVHNLDRYCHFHRLPQAPVETDLIQPDHGLHMFDFVHEIGSSLRRYIRLFPDDYDSLYQFAFSTLERDRVLPVTKENDDKIQALLEKHMPSFANLPLYTTKAERKDNDHDSNSLERCGICETEVQVFRGVPQAVFRNIAGSIVIGTVDRYQRVVAQGDTVIRSGLVLCTRCKLYGQKLLNKMNPNRAPGMHAFIKF